MSFATELNLPGNHALLLNGSAGQIEAELSVPLMAHDRYCAILGHPHSLQGGTMHNKVVTTLVRLFRDLAIPTLRFNFRGVGQSDGAYDAGIGESEDMLALINQWRLFKPDIKPIFAGFSFGSYVAYRAAAQTQAALLVTIAPSVEHFNYAEFIPMPKPWLVVHGESDDVVPAPVVVEFAAQNELPLVYFAATGHFFHGKLIELRECLLPLIREQLAL